MQFFQIDTKIMVKLVPNEKSFYFQVPVGNIMDKFETETKFKSLSSL